jgi:hypothetical protein
MFPGKLRTFIVVFSKNLYRNPLYYELGLRIKKFYEFDFYKKNLKI